MDVLTFQITEKSKIPFILELLANFDFVKDLKISDKIELIEEEGLKKAMDIAEEEENDFLNAEDALKFLEN